MKKKIFYILLIFITILSFFSNECFSSNTIVKNPSELNSTEEHNLNILSDHVLLMERSTGNILYEKNSNEKMYPASTTKILTAILVLENCNLNESAEVTSDALKAVPKTYTTCNIHVGEIFSVKDLLYTMLIRSANDAANVLAIHISGSISDFAKLMNKKAKEVGCTSSNFTNPSGFHDENHYSTARDLALIADFAMNLDVFRDIVSTSSCSLPSTEKYPHDDRSFTTSNSLINPDNVRYFYEYATGIKTGYTNSSKDCIVASAKKDGIEFIVVVLGADSINGIRQKYIDCKTLFDFAFDNYITYYKNLQAKRDSKFNPFTELYNFFTGENEDKNQNQLSNTVSQSDIAVVAEPVSEQNFQVPDVENKQAQPLSFFKIIVLFLFITVILSAIIFIFIKQKRSRITKKRRRHR